MKKTKNNTGLVLNIAFNCGGRAEIIYGIKQIVKKIQDRQIDINDIDEKMFSNYLYTREQPDPDLIIRTSGEMRLSNFLTWQSVYSELYFSKKYWPDFKEDDILLAIEDYTNRTRKFGGK